LLAAPLVLYLVVFYAYPVLLMLSRSVYEKGWTLEVFSKLLRDPVFWRVMQITGTISFIVTIVCLLLAYPVALFLARCKQSTANLLIILVLIPFWTSILVRTYAWMVLLGRRGIINNFLVATGLIDQPLNTQARSASSRRSTSFLALHGAADLFDIEGLTGGFISAQLRLLGARPLAGFRQVLLPPLPKFQPMPSNITLAIASTSRRFSQGPAT
jgi:putative spermidine/putrescine transport system permease protein